MRIWSRFIYFNRTFSLNMIIKKFKSKIEKELEKRIDLDKDFLNNNIDSLDLISIVMILEKELKIKISEDKLSKVSNFKTLEKVIKKLKL